MFSVQSWLIETSSNSLQAKPNQIRIVFAAADGVIGSHVVELECPLWVFLRLLHQPPAENWPPSTSRSAKHRGDGSDGFTCTVAPIVTLPPQRTPSFRRTLLVEDTASPFIMSTPAARRVEQPRFCG